jgi:hypothetical protein
MILSFFVVLQSWRKMVVEIFLMGWKREFLMSDGEFRWDQLSCSGRVMVTLVPRPGSLSMVMLPSCSLMNSLA